MFRKTHFLQFFEESSSEEQENYDDYMVSEVCPSHLYEEDEQHYLHQCSQEMMLFTYLSTNYYKPRNSYIHNPFKNETLLWGGIQIQAADNSNNEFPRDNSYLNYALGVKNSYELPVQPIEENEAEQVIEGFLYKKAKTHNRENYLWLKKLLGQDKINSVEAFSRHSFTYEEPGFVTNLSYGLVPRYIPELKPQNAAYWFFNRDIQITSAKVNFEDCEILVPKMQILKITNRNSSSLLIRDILTSSPEVTVYLSEGFTFPLRLSPYETLEIQVVFTPETLGNFESLYQVILEKWIFVGSFNAQVVPNRYDLEPIYMTDVLVNETIEIPLYVTNPLPSQSLIIQEIYSTDSFVQLKWPCGELIDQKFDVEGNAIPLHQSSLRSEYLKLAPNQKSLVVNMFFTVNQSQDYHAEIHIRTSKNDIVRVPLYYHVHTDLMKFTPTIADFGMVPLNFEILKLQVHARHRIREPIQIQDVLVPISDKRLDYLFIEAKQFAIKEPLKPNHEVFLGYVLFNPLKEGILKQKLQILATGTQTNKTYKFELPILANVIPDTKLLQVANKNEEKSAFPTPLVTFDISDYLINQHLARMLFVIPQYRPVILSAPIVLKNTFNRPIQIRGIINRNSELKITLLPGVNKEMMYQDLILKPNETIKFAQVEIYTTNLKITQGVKYISIQVNNTFVPAAVQIYDNNLLCVWEEEQQKSRFIQCNQGYEITFGHVAIGEPKFKRLNITNMNPHNLTIESVQKSAIDDLVVQVDRLLDKSGQILNLPQSHNHEEKESKMSLISSKKTKKVVNFVIQPYQTLCITFVVQSKEAKLKIGRLDFMMKEVDSPSLNFNYSYTVIEGNLSIVPQIIRFNPGYPGMIQNRPLIAKSSFDIPIIIRQIISSDVRIFPQFPLQNSNIIMPRNRTEVAQINFDPGKLQAGVAPIIDPNFYGHLTQIDPMLSQNLLQVLNGGTPAPNSQITMITNQGNTFHINNIGHFNQMHPQNQKSLITVQDLLSYREKQKIWEKLGSLGKTEISAQITIETNVFQNISVQVKAHLTKPSIIVDDTIDFDIVQIGTMSMKSIKIINPSEEPLMISLFLTNEPIGNAIEQGFKNSNRTDEELLSQIIRTQQSKESFFNLYCATKLTEFEEVSGINEGIDVTNIGQLIISSYQNQSELCFYFDKLLTSDSYLDQDQKDHLRFYVEQYYKDLINELQQQAQQQNNYNNIFKNFLSVNKQPGKDGQLPNIASLFQHLAQSQAQQFPDLEILASNINRNTQNRHIDQYTMNLMKNSEKANQRGFFESLISILRYKQNKIKELQQRQQQQQHSRDYGMQAQAQTQQYQKDLKAQRKFRLKNSVLNEIIIQNDTSKVTLETYENQSQVNIISNQSFYINPKIQGVQFRVDPRSNFTIREAIIFQPQSLFQEQLTMNLLIKNNLTVLHQVELRGSSGTGLIEFTKVLKKSQSAENYINVQNINQGFHDLNIDAENIADPVTQRNIKDRILSYIFGEMDLHYDPRFIESNPRQISEVEKVLYFTIMAEDMLVIQGPGQNEATRSITQLIEDSTQNLKLNNYHKRVFIAQNSGNLPVVIESMSIEGKGCKAYGITIENCHSFTLRPGEQHQLHISYVTDYTIGKMKRTIVLESKTFVQEFVLQINMPMNLLPLANQFSTMTPYQETIQFFVKIMITGFGFICLLLVARDIISYFKFKQDQLDQEKLINKLDHDTYLKLSNQPKIKELAIIKDAVGHEQIFNVFQSAQEKFENTNQLLLKEVSNICSKKNLVCLEAQRQATEAELRRRQHNRLFFQQHIKDYNFLTLQEDTQVKKEEDKVQKGTKNQKTERPFIEEIGGRKSHVPYQESRESHFDDFSMTDSQEPISKEQSFKGFQDQSQQINSSEHKQPDQTEFDYTNQEKQEQQDQTQLKEQLKQAPTQTKAPRISKKQKRETAQRIKEQQQLEERFRQQQLKREQEEELQRKIKEKEEQKIKELARIAEEERMKLMVETERNQNKERQDQKDISEEQPQNSRSESVQIDKDNSLNLSQIQESGLNNEEKETKLYDKQFDNLEYSLEQRTSFISEPEKAEQERSQIIVSQISDNKSEVNKPSKNSANQSESDIKESSQQIKNQDYEEKSEISDNKIEATGVQEEQHIYENQKSETTRSYDKSAQNDQIQSFNRQQQHQQQSTHPTQAGYLRRGYHDKFQVKPSYGSKEQYSSRGKGQQAQYQYQKGQYYQQNRGQSSQALLSIGSYRKAYHQQNEDEDAYERRAFNQPKDFMPTRKVIQTNPRGQPSSSFSSSVNKGHQPQGETQNYFRGRGRSHYRHSQDYDEEYDYSHQQSSYNQGYQRRNYHKDEFEEEYQDDKYYRQRASKREDQDYGYSYGSDEEEVKRYDKQQSYQAYSNQYQRDDDYSQVSYQRVSQAKTSNKINERQNSQDFGGDEDGKRDQKGKLSKEDLKPFFESQRKNQPEEAKQNSKEKPKLVENVQSSSPKQSNTSSSIFNFNPLNLFSSKGQKQSQQDDSSSELEKDVNKICEVFHKEEDENYGEEEKSEDSNYQPQKESTDFYNAFKSASSLFSKPLFGATVSRQQEQQKAQKAKPQTYQAQQNDARFSPVEEEEEESSYSLFSGSLFGDSGPFGIPRKQQTQYEDQPRNRLQQPSNLNDRSSDFFPPPGLTLQGNSGAPQIYRQHQIYDYVLPNQPSYLPQERPQYQTVYGNQEMTGYNQGFHFSESIGGLNRPSAYSTQFNQQRQGSYDWQGQYDHQLPKKKNHDDTSHF